MTTCPSDLEETGFPYKSPVTCIVVKPGMGLGWHPAAPCLPWAPETPLHRTPLPTSHIGLRTKSSHGTNYFCSACSSWALEQAGSWEGHQRSEHRLYAGPLLLHPYSSMTVHASTRTGSDFFYISEVNLPSHMTLHP